MISLPHVLAGTVAGASEAAFIHPLDTYKVISSLPLSLPLDAPLVVVERHVYKLPLHGPMCVMMWGCIAHSLEMVIRRDKSQRAHP